MEAEIKNRTIVSKELKVKRAMVECWAYKQKARLL